MAIFTTNRYKTFLFTRTSAIIIDTPEPTTRWKSWRKLGIGEHKEAPSLVAHRAPPPSFALAPVGASGFDTSWSLSFLDPWFQRFEV